MHVPSAISLVVMAFAWVVANDARAEKPLACDAFLDQAVKRMFKNTDSKYETFDALMKNSRGLKAVDNGTCPKVSARCASVSGKMDSQSFTLHSQGDGTNDQWLVDLKLTPNEEYHFIFKVNREATPPCRVSSLKIGSNSDNDQQCNQGRCCTQKTNDPYKIKGCEMIQGFTAKASQDHPRAQPRSEPGTHRAE